MSLTLQKDSGSPAAATVQKKRKILRVILQADDAGNRTAAIHYSEWSEDANAAVVGSVMRVVKVLAEVDLNNAARADIDSVFTKALAAI